MSSLDFEKGKLKQILLNSVLRTLLIFWHCLAGANFLLSDLATLLDIPQDVLETKLKILANMGLVDIQIDCRGKNKVTFIVVSHPELDNFFDDFLTNRRIEYDSILQKVISFQYLTLFSLPLNTHE
jgi:hypothetical protein